MRFFSLQVKGSTVLNVLLIKTINIEENILEQQQLKGKLVRALGTHPIAFVNDAITDVQPRFGDEAARSLNTWQGLGGSPGQEIFTLSSIV